MAQSPSFKPCLSCRPSSCRRLRFARKKKVRVSQIQLCRLTLAPPRPSMVAPPNPLDLSRPCLTPAQPCSHRKELAPSPQPPSGRIPELLYLVKVFPGPFGFFTGYIRMLNVVTILSFNINSLRLFPFSSWILLARSLSVPSKFCYKQRSPDPTAIPKSEITLNNSDAGHRHCVIYCHSPVGCLSA